VILVVDGHLEQHRRLCGKGGNGRGKPGGQAVGIHRDTERDPRHAVRRQRGQRLMQFLFEQAHAVHVLAQAPTGVRGTAGLLAHHQGAAYTLLQQAYPLRNGRGCHVHRARRAIKTALTHHSGKGRQGSVIKHGLSKTEEA
jgi:hypothetical protein